VNGQGRSKGGKGVPRPHVGWQHEQYKGCKETCSNFPKGLQGFPIPEKKLFKHKKLKVVAVVMLINGYIFAAIIMMSADLD